MKQIYPKSYTMTRQKLLKMLNSSYEIGKNDVGYIKWITDYRQKLLNSLNKVIYE